MYVENGEKNTLNPSLTLRKRMLLSAYPCILSTLVGNAYHSHHPLHPLSTRTGHHKRRS